MTSAPKTPHHTCVRLLLTALLALAAAAPAQTAPTNLLLEETAIRSGTTANFETAQKDLCAAAVHAGAPSCLVFAAAALGPSDRYLTLIPFATFARFDDPAALTRGLSPEEARSLFARRLPWIVTERHSTLTAAAPIPTTKPLFLLREYRLRPGHLEAFVTALRPLLPPGTLLLRTTLGESPDRLLLLTPLDTYAQLDTLPTLPPALADHLQSTDTALLRLRSDLSAPAPQH